MELNRIADDMPETGQASFFSQVRMVHWFLRDTHSIYHFRETARGG